ncbi:NAD(P)H-binding protein [Rhodohalobacter mucosus]|uniref:NAD(P)-dependent oxidoreductase n=1 Tax=Rhodohalobacter mucosus TaxID=2079485 RepID=A0A316TV41_9BACT|nr:NAD(P)H-binding protein [Rhodohalobacter mucosus]PWN06262.1 NAD(P)-dependent oxidoreductase [Rhodohalobacter mucosus]
MVVSILGCGWLGLPLAQFLKKEVSGIAVKGSTTSKSKLPLLKQAGITSYLIRLPDDLHDSDSASFWESDILILNIPPSAGTDPTPDSYPQLISDILKRAAEGGISKIIFTSSTSVYSSTGGLTTEEHAKPGTAARPSGEAVLKAENVIMESGLEYVILRLGGLYGYNRHPIKYLSGRKGLRDPLKPVNLIHQDDCIRVIAEVLGKEIKNEIFNVVSDGHPPRGEFYTSAARHFELPPPEFKDTPAIDYRVVSNKKLKKELNFSFTYPNPMDHTP